MELVATLGLDIDSSGTKRAAKDLEQLGATGDKVASSMRSSFTAAFAAMAGGLSVGFLGREFLRNTIEAQAATAQLEAAVRSTGRAAGLTVPQLQAMAAQLQQVSTFSDEAVQRAQALLLTFQSIRGDTFRDATAAVVDLATRMGGDLQGAALQVGKALQDPTEGLTALKRSGVSFSEAQQEVIKNLQSTGQLAAAQALILKELQVEFGGSAAAARDTLGGALTGLKNDFGELFEVSRGGSSVLIDSLNGLGAALRALKPHLDALAAPVNVLRTSFAGLGALSDTLAVGFLQMAQRIQGALGGLVVTFGTAIEALGGQALGQQLQSAGDRMVAEAAKIHARLAVALDASLIERFNAANPAGGTGAGPAAGGGGSGAPARDPALLKAAQDMIAALQQEADLFGKSAEQARLYKIATTDLTAAERALAIVLANRITAAEQAAALRQQEIKAIEDKTARVLEEAEALEVARKATVALSLSIRDALAVRKLEAEFAFQQTLADIKKGDPKGSGGAKEIVDEVQALQDALTHAKALAQTIQQGVTGTLQLAEAAGAVDAAFARTVTTITQVATSIDVLSKAIAASASGDILSSSLSILGGLASLFGGGDTRAAQQAEESRRIQQENTEAIRKNTEARSFGLNAAGKDIADALAIAQRVLGQGNVGSISTQDSLLLQKVADSLNFTFDNSSVSAFLDSLAAFQLLLKQNELIQFADTFSGKLKALEASWRAFNVTDPLQKLTDQLKVAADVLVPIHGGPVLGTGSIAIRNASAGLDLTTQAGLDQLTQNLQALFRQLQAGTLSASQLGGLTAQEFLDQLTGLIDLIKQAEDAARARERNLQDLEVRRLRATGQGDAADAMAFALQQQREYQDAVLAGADAVTLSTLAEVQRAEALFRSTEAMQGAIDTLKQFSDSLKLDRTLSTLSPVQQLEEARRQYQSVLAAAQGGDATAAGQLPEAARAFLEASRAVNASGPAYAADFARVMSETDALRQMFQDQKDIQQLIYDTNKSELQEHRTSNEHLGAVVAILREGFKQSIDELKAFREESGGDNQRLSLKIESLTV